MERYHLVKQDLRLYKVSCHQVIVRAYILMRKNVVHIATYTNRAATQEITESTIVRALRQCVAQHAALSAVILDTSSERPRVARLHSLDLSKHVRILPRTEDEPDAAQRFLNTAHDESFDDFGIQRPHWRVLVQPINAEKQQRFHLAFVYSHVLIDGRSGQYFHQSFLKALNHAYGSQDDDCEAVITTANVPPLPPSLDQAGKFTATWSFLYQNLVPSLLRSWLFRLFGIRLKDKPLPPNPADHVWTGAWTPPPCDPKADYPVRATEILDIPSATIQQAVTVCRHNKAKLTGLLHHLMVHSLAHVLHARGVPNERFVTETVCDLRRAMKCGDGAMACYPGPAFDMVHVKAQNRNRDNELEQPPFTVDWNAVRRTTGYLAERSTSLMNHYVHLLRWISNFHGFTKRNAAAAPKISLLISNLGEFDGGAAEAAATSDPGSGWTVDYMLFSPPTDRLGPPVLCDLISVKGGPMTITANWCPGRLGVQDEDALIHEFLMELKQRLDGLPLLVDKEL